MLVLSRKKDERIVIGRDHRGGPQLFDRAGNPVSIEILCIEIRGDKVRLGVEAPRAVSVHRDEVQRAVEAELAAAAG